MCTGKKFEIRLTITMGFDSEREAQETAYVFRAATTAIAAADGIPGEISCQLRERVDAATSAAN